MLNKDILDFFHEIHIHINLMYLVIMHITQSTVIKAVRCTDNPKMLVNDVDPCTIGIINPKDDGTSDYQPIILWNITRVIR